MTQILSSKIIGAHPKHLIIAHGLFGQMDNWNTLGKKFADYYTTHLVDLRNHGRSFHDSETSHQAMSEDLLRYLEFNQLSSAHFLGHSLGGKVVMELALTHPESVEKLIVADMAPKTYPPHHQGIIAGLNNVNFLKVEKRSDVEAYLEPYIPVQSVRQFLMKNVYRTPEGGYQFRFNLKALTDDYDKLVSNNLPEKTFDKPTLFLKGQLSDYITSEDLPVITHYFPNATIETVLDAGHWLHAENPNDLLEKSLNFLG